MQIDTDVLSALSNAEVTSNTLKLVAQLDRKLYMRTNKVLEAAGGAWNRKVGAHVFNGDASERLEQILATGSIEIPKDEFNFFASPPDVVQHLMHLAQPKPGMRALEPEAGRGAIADALVDAGCIVDCIELMEANHAFLAKSSRYNSLRKADFLTIAPRPEYDLIVMNPPFLRQSDIRHVEHATRFLAPQGCLVAVMAASVSFRQNRLTQDFREMVYDRGGVIDDLPDGSFKPSGTLVRTVTVTIPA